MTYSRRSMLASRFQTGLFLGSLYLVLAGLTPLGGQIPAVLLVGGLLWVYRGAWSRVLVRLGDDPERAEIRARMTPVTILPERADDRVRP